VKAEEKLKLLKENLAEMGSALIAFSGGVDSTFLAYTANEVPGKNMLAVYARSAVRPEEEFEEAQKIAAEYGFRFAVVESSELDDPRFVANPPDRCYYCKYKLFQQLKDIAAAEGIKWVADGSNYDDLNDYRPGRKALGELGIRSPLCEAELTKEEIREISKKAGLPTWDKPASPCLATRIPYGTPVSIDILKRIGEGERILKNTGFSRFRLRHHGDIARIEIDEKDIKLVLNDSVRGRLNDALKGLGYTYITLDLKGYRSGSMDEGLTMKEKKQHG